MLAEAGFNPKELFYATVLSFRPAGSKLETVWTTEKKEANKWDIPVSPHKGAYLHPRAAQSLVTFEAHLRNLQPRLIIALGNFPLWVLTGNASVAKWRGSLESTEFGCSAKVIATYSPEMIRKVWSWRWIAVRDLQRAVTESLSTQPPPEMGLVLCDNFREAKKQLTVVIGALDVAVRGVPIASDIETISRHIACIGFAWGPLNGFCVPFMGADNSHIFSLDEEAEIVGMTQKILLHPSALIIGQNWSYDAQHIARSWGFLPRADFDTMLMQHVCFPGTPKDLAFLASLYCDNYVYWKDELTDYRTLPKDLEQFWRYNAKDCCYTLQIFLALKGVVERLGLVEQSGFLHRLNRHVIKMMIRGVSIDKKEKGALVMQLQPELEARKETISQLIGRELNISSPKQMKEFFYEEMQMKVVRSRSTFQPTTDDSALKLFGQREPILKPLTDLIAESRSIGVFLSTFVMMPLDTDGRMRCNFNVGGTETFRFSSSKNPFGSGGNLQNIPKGSEDSELDPTAFRFPNLRKMFKPDYGYELFDVDLAGADAQIVAWEADDADLKAKFRSGEKIHALNAKDIYGGLAGSDGKKAPYYKMAKMGCHLTNYGGGPRTLSISCGMTIHEAEAFQKKWFQMHPGIKEWHERILNELMTRRCIYNKFGFRRFYFDRIEGLLPEALAWIPQSTVALIINQALCRIAESGSSAELLLQVHDSLVGQYPKNERFLTLPVLRECLAVPVPYDDPLTIGTSLDLSIRSWGELTAQRWE